MHTSTQSAEFCAVSHCPKTWHTPLQFAPDAVWTHKDGRVFIAVMPRPSGGNTLLITPAQWEHGWGYPEIVFEVYADGEIGDGRGTWMHIDDFETVGSIAL